MAEALFQDPATACAALLATEREFTPQQRQFLTEGAEWRGQLPPRLRFWLQEMLWRNGLPLVAGGAHD